MTNVEIKDGDKTLAILIRGDEWPTGLNFVTSETSSLQVGTWQYQKGSLLLPHKHKPVSRNVQNTQEIIFVKSGRLKADIYSERCTIVKSLELAANDALVLLAGGHGFEILEDNTQVLEVKNGPYVGAEQDRQRI